MIEKLISVIIVSWNGKKHLSYCLPFLKKIDYPTLEVIAVDNSSTDGSVEYVEKNFPRVKIIQNKKNLGFAKANNIGFKKAKGEYIPLLNNDTKVTPDFLTKLVDVMKKDEKLESMYLEIMLVSVCRYLNF